MAECPSKAAGVSENNPQSRRQKSKGQNGKSRSEKKTGNRKSKMVVAQTAPAPMHPPTTGGAVALPTAEHQLQSWRGATNDGLHHLHSTHGQYTSKSFNIYSLVVEKNLTKSNVSCSNVEDSVEKNLPKF